MPSRPLAVIPALLMLGLGCSESRSTTPPATEPRETIAIQVSEGTELSFDLSADGRSIVFDLLGQLWMVPAQGGDARAVTDAVRDVAEDLDPAFSPDGKRVAFRAERRGRTGLWLLDLDSGVVRQLSQLPDPDATHGRAAWSPDGRTLAYARILPPDTAGARWRLDVALLDVATGVSRELAIPGLKGIPRDPVWLDSGARIAFILAGPDGAAGPIWIADSSGANAHAITAAALRASAPAFTADGSRVAYFAGDSAGRPQVWVLDVVKGRASGAPRQVTSHKDVAQTTVRWTPDGSALLYSADGKLWTLAATGGSPSEIPFTAALSLTRNRSTLAPVRFADGGTSQPARGFTALALSPDGSSFGAIALGKLWIVPIGGSAKPVADAPLGASGLGWSPDGARVAWSAGRADQEDIFATDLATGLTRRITTLPGRELYPTFSPDGRLLAFIHMEKGARLRVVPADAEDVAAAATRDLGEVDANGSNPPLWSPASDGLLISPAARVRTKPRATFVPLTGERQIVTKFPDAPIFLQWTAQRIQFVRNDRLWQAPFDRSGLLGEPRRLGNAPALYASASRDGTLLFVSDSGLRIRRTDGSEQSIGWPISFPVPVAKPLLIRNLRVVDGSGSPASAPQDVLVEKGRIARMAAAGTLPHTNEAIVDAEGRTAIPGLLDMHAHIYQPDLLPGFLYFGVTTMRDHGASMAPLVGAADAIAAGVMEGPRLSYGGFQFYSDWPFDEEQGRGIEPEADSGHVARAVALAQAFGAAHIKTRTFRRWDINEHMIAEAHRRGMRTTGHCAHPLPLIAAGIDSKEHIGICTARGNRYMYDDMVQLFRAAGIGVVPTIAYISYAVHLDRPVLIEEDAEAAPFLPSQEAFAWMLDMSPARRKEWNADAELARQATLKLSRAGVTLGTGTDIWQVPTGVHMEMAEMVAAGLTPLEAIKAATGGAARILGAGDELGTIAVGMKADLIILDADPVADIRNTRRIWQVVKDGKMVDRAAILAAAREGRSP